GNQHNGAACQLQCGAPAGTASLFCAYGISGAPYGAARIATGDGGRDDRGLDGYCRESGLKRPSFMTYRTGNRSRAHLWLAACAAAATLASVRAQTKPPQVSIEGGRDATGQNYKWTVQNKSSVPITSVRFPHYHADIFVTPPGWTQHCTAMSGAGGPD